MTYILIELSAASSGTAPGTDGPEAVHDDASAITELDAAAIAQVLEGLAGEFRSRGVTAMDAYVIQGPGRPRTENGIGQVHVAPSEEARLAALGQHGYADLTSASRAFIKDVRHALFRPGTSWERVLNMIMYVADDVAGIAAGSFVGEPDPGEGEGHPDVYGVGEVLELLAEEVREALLNRRGKISLGPPGYPCLPSGEMAAPVSEDALLAFFGQRADEKLAAGTQALIGMLRDSLHRQTGETYTPSEIRSMIAAAAVDMAAISAGQ
jgi:hypothetical protein